MPVTFGQVFKKGDIKRGPGVKVAGMEGQADVKRFYEDGSIRFAVISEIVPETPAGGQATVEISEGDIVSPTREPRPRVSPADLLKTDFDAVVTLKFPDGTSVSASARKLLESAGDKGGGFTGMLAAPEWRLVPRSGK